MVGQEGSELRRRSRRVVSVLEEHVTEEHPGVGIARVLGHGGVDRRPPLGQQGLVVPRNPGQPQEPAPIGQGLGLAGLDREAVRRQRRDKFLGIGRSLM